MNLEQLQIELERKAEELAKCHLARDAMHQDIVREDKTIRALTLVGIISACLAFAVFIIMVTL